MLAQLGYDVEQNPPPPGNGKKPDYKIEGRYFDCYAPTSPNADQIRNGISDKVSSDQSERIVLNLDDCPRTTNEIGLVLRRRPISGLKEILVVEGGMATEFYPFSGERGTGNNGT